MLGIRHNEYFISFRLQDLRGHLQQLLGPIRSGAGAGAGHKTKRLTGIRIQNKKSLSHFTGFVIFVLAAPDHLPFAIRLDPVRINGQHFAQKMAKGAANFAQCNLQALRFGHRMAVEKKMNGAIGGDKGQPIGQFKSFLTE